MKTLLLALTLIGSVGAASLPEEIDRILATNPSAKNAFWGIQVVDLRTGRTVYERNRDHFFVPASNTKLFTTAMALTRLGPDFRYQTRVMAAAPPDSAGTIAGPVRFVGGGDPNLSARAIPYRPGPVTGNPLAAIEEFAAQVAARGVKRIMGDIVGDDTWYVWEPYAIGWGIDDPQSDDGPPISALTINDNAVTLRVEPGPRDGELAAISFDPPLEFYRIDNRVRTVAAGGVRRIRFNRIPASLDARLSGTIPLRDQGQDLAISIEDPARFAAMALKRALQEQGIAVEGEATALHLYPNEVPDLRRAAAVAEQTGVELARRESARLIEDLKITDKVSQNLHAELTLRAVARARRNVGSFEAGSEEMKAFLTDAAIETETYLFRDGSGLSRQNLVTPATVVKLLRFMYASPNREAWMSLLPVGGQDGSIRTRFVDTPAAGRVLAKTGSLSHVSALSGYIHKVDGTWLAFSILVNNYNGQTADVRGAMDQICNLIVE